MNSLDESLSVFDQLLLQTKDLVLDRYRKMDKVNAFSGVTPAQVEEWFNEAIPEEGMDKELLLKLVEEKVIGPATNNIAPKMFAYVMAGGTQVSVLAELIATAVNQNTGKWHLAPIMCELEKRVIQWGADFIGYDSGAAGVLVSGGSAANLTGLTVARNIYFEKEGVRQKGLFGMPPMMVYASDETHGCVDKSIDLLGIGMDNYRKIPCLEDCTIDLEALEAQIKADLAEGYRPFCLIGNAGTVNTGAIDPLDKLADIAEQYDLWYHVDGAYGGLAAAVSNLNPRYKGMEKADSIAVDFHKWLYQPFEAGCTLVKSWDQLRRAYYKKASYLSTDPDSDGRLDFNEHYFQLSRSAKALKIWMSFKAYGAQQLRDMIEKDVELTHYLADQVDAAPDFELSNRPDLAIVCFRYTGGLDVNLDKAMIDKLNKDIIPALEQDGRVFITGTQLHQQPVIRACLINHRMQKEHVEYLIHVIQEVGQQVLSNSTSTIN